MSAFRLELRLPSEPGLIARCTPAPRYDAELDGIESILHDLCELVARSPGVEFIASGFGQERWPRWPAHATCDLCLLLEQMPAVVEALLSGADAFQIGFVEQGWYRVLYVERRGEMLVILCTSGDDWTPSPAELVVRTEEFSAMLRQFLENFVGFAKSACPESVQHPCFQQWWHSIAPLLGEPD